MTNDIGNRISQHISAKKIKFDSHHILIHGLSKNLAHVFENTLIYYTTLFIGMDIRNISGNTMYFVKLLQNG